MPKSLKPMSSIEKGTHAILGKVKSPTANEPIVLPKPWNFTIARPTMPPTAIDIANPAASRHSVVPIPMARELFAINSPIEIATCVGEGNNVFGQSSRTVTSCHNPTNTAKKSTTLATSVVSIRYILLPPILSLLFPSTSVALPVDRALSSSFSNLKITFKFS